MRILFLTSRLPYPPTRGDKLRVFNFLSRLSKKHTITLLSFIESEKQRDFVGELKKYCAETEVILQKPWRSYLNCLFSIFSGTPLQVAYYHSGAMKRKVKTLTKENRFDAIYVHLFRMAPYAEDTKNITTILDLCDAVSLHLKRTIKFKKGILWPIFLLEWLRVKKYERHIIKKFDKALLISEVDRRAISADSGIEIIHNGVDHEYFKPERIKRKKIKNIIFLGHLRTFYNVDAVLYFYDRIFPIIKEHITNVKFLVVGAYYPSQFKKVEGDASVTLTGEVPDTRRFLNASSVFVCPLRVGSGLQNKLLEAMAMGLPVVTTSVGYEGIDAVKGKEIFVEDRPEDFAKRVIELLNNDSLRERVSQSAKNFIGKNFKWEDSIAAMEALFSNKNYEN